MRHPLLSALLLAALTGPATAFLPHRRRSSLSLGSPAWKKKEARSPMGLLSPRSISMVASGDSSSGGGGGERCSIGVDVGTGSARCGVFSLDGKLLGTASVDITMTQPGDGKQSEYSEFYMQSSTNIWESICKVSGWWGGGKQAKECRAKRATIE